MSSLIDAAELENGSGLVFDSRTRTHLAGVAVERHETAGQTARRFHGQAMCSAAATSWYWGTFGNVDVALDLPRA